MIGAVTIVEIGPILRLPNPSAIEYEGFSFPTYDECLEEFSGELSFDASAERSGFPDWCIATEGDGQEFSGSIVCEKKGFTLTYKLDDGPWSFTELNPGAPSPVPKFVDFASLATYPELFGDDGNILVEHLSGGETICEKVKSLPPYACDQTFTVTEALSLAFANAQLFHAVLSSAIAAVFYRLRKTRVGANEAEMHGISLS